MRLAKAKPLTNKNIYSTGITYDHRSRLSKYFYSTGHWYLGVEQKNSGVRGGGVSQTLAEL
jgi:hypothetical protein